METTPTINNADAVAKYATEVACLYRNGVNGTAAPRRQRKRSLTRVLRAASQAGADRVIVDGVVIALSPAAAVLKSDANEWDAVLSEVDHG
jgi:hypothetical protein